MNESQAPPSVQKAIPTWTSPFKGNLNPIEYHRLWTTALSASKSTLALLENDPAAPNEVNLLKVWDTLCGDIGQLAAFPFQRCHPDEAMRKEADECDKAASRLLTQAMQSKKVYERMNMIDPSSLKDDLTRRFLRKSLSGMKRAGAGLGESQTKAAAEMEERLTVLQQDFARNIDQGMKTWKVGVKELAGLPDDFFKTHPADQEGRITISTGVSDKEAVIGFCDIRATREKMFMMWCNVANPDNYSVFTELVQLRGKVANLKGYASAAALILENEMLNKPDKVTELLSDFRERYEPLATNERDQLHAKLVDLSQIKDGDTIQQWDVEYAQNKLLAKIGGVDMKAIKQYFPAGRTIQGVLNLAQALFGISCQPVDVPTWHESVQVHDVYDNKKALIGRLYLDLHPRRDKYSHCCAADIVVGRKGLQSQVDIIPEVLMAANVAGGEGALSSLQEATNLFHELGHCLHKLFAGRSAEWLAFSGSRTERDFVETISQAQEEWLKDPIILQTFAQNEAGEVIPDHICEAIRLNSAFGNALEWHRQATYAAAALAIFLGPLKNDTPPKDAVVVWKEEEEAWSLFPAMPGCFALSFGHLASPGYGPRYYAYLFSRIIACDVLSAFEEGAGLMDLAVAQRLKEKILSQGGQKDGWDLIQDFLGRPLSYDAFGKWLESGQKIKWK